jgi:hypothetical protein
MAQAPYTSAQTNQGTVSAVAVAPVANARAPGSSSSAPNGQQQQQEEIDRKSIFSLLPVSAVNEESVNLMAQWYQVKPWLQQMSTQCVRLPGIIDF